jgi:hypothetical protein
MPFQSKVNALQAPGVAGDFASTNPFASLLAGPGEYVAPSGGLLVGNFAWFGPAGQVSQSYVSGYQLGFVGRDQQALITAYLGEATMLIPQGFMVNAFVTGDFWAKFEGGATPGQTVYADKTNGAPIAAASGSTPAAASATGLVGSTADGAGSITAGVLTVTAAPTHGSYMPGDTLAGTGIPAGTTIVSQLTGTTGSTGTYEVSNPTLTVAAFTNLQSANSAFATFSAVGTGTLIPGDTLVSALLQANTELGVQVTGTAGAAGIYNITPYQAATASGTITTAGAVATAFFVGGTYTAGNGEVAKITSY